MAKRRGFGWSNKYGEFGILSLEVDGMPVRLYGTPGAEMINHATDRLGVPLGTRMELPDGRLFAYCVAGGSDLGPGLFNTYLTTPTNEQTVTVAHGIGTKTVTVTGTFTADQCKDGYIIVSAGTGIGEMYRVKSNTATVGTTGTFTLYGDGLKTAWSTSDTDVDVYECPYKGQIVNPVDAQQKPTSVALTTITTLYYYWGLIKGICPIQLDVNAAAGLEFDEKVIEASVSHAGFGLIPAAPASQTANVFGLHRLGYIVREGDCTDNEANLCYIDLT